MKKCFIKLFWKTFLSTGFHIIHVFKRFSFLAIANSEWTPRSHPLKAVNRTPRRPEVHLNADRNLDIRKEPISSTLLLTTVVNQPISDDVGHFRDIKAVASVDHFGLKLFFLSFLVKLSIIFHFLCKFSFFLHQILFVSPGLYRESVHITKQWISYKSQGHTLADTKVYMYKQKKG